MNVYSTTYNQLPLITAPKIHTDLLWDLSFLFVGLAVLYFLFVFFFRNRLSKRSDQVKERKRALSPMISEFLFHENDAGKDEMSNYVNLKIEIRQLLKDDFNRKVLSEVLLDLRKDVSGQTQARLFKLYQDLGLHHDDFSKLKSWRWEVVSKAILNLTQMQVKEAYSFVVKFINDKRPTIRKQAEIAVVTLRSEGIQYFLDTTKHKISEWQQLKLMDVLRNQKDYQPPRFKSWLTSTNRHVVLFALRLIKYYNQNDADAALIELVKHKNNQIKEEAIGCIREFHIVAALPTLKLVFWKCSVDVKISILNAVGALGSKSDLDFLQLIEKKESNFSVRSKAHASINAIAPDSIMPSKGVVNSSKYTIPDDLKIDDKRDSPDLEATVPVTEPIGSSVSEVLPTLTAIDQESEVTPQASPKPDAQPTPQNQHTAPAPQLRDEKNTQDEETLCFDFLPLVVPSKLKTDAASNDKATKQDGTKKPERDEKKKSALEITPDEIVFLPLVTEIEEAIMPIPEVEAPIVNPGALHELEVTYVLVTPVEDILVDYDIVEAAQQAPTVIDYNTPEILETIVEYNEIDPISGDSAEDSIAELPEPYFLSPLLETPEEDATDPKSDLHHQSFQLHDDMEPQDEQKFKKIIQNLIAFNEQEPDAESPCESANGPLLEFGDEFIDSRFLSPENADAFAEKDTDSTADTPSETQHDGPDFEFSIPKAVHCEGLLEEVVELKANTEESRMQLLDDVTEMGDAREIPLLNELLVNEKYRTVKDRVKRLIKQFSETDKQPEPEILLKPFNVFEDLFRTCDTEAKLILMDEIVAVGDASELVFLEGLLEDVDKAISAKAAHVLEELRAKLAAPEQVKNGKFTKDQSPEVIADMEVLVEEETLAEYDSLMEELQIAPPQASELFELSFELSEPLGPTLTDDLAQPQKNNHDSLFGQLFSFSTKFMGKRNG